MANLSPQEFLFLYILSCPGLSSPRQVVLEAGGVFFSVVNDGGVALRSEQQPAQAVFTIEIKAGTPPSFGFSEEGSKQEGPKL